MDCKAIKKRCLLLEQHRTWQAIPASHRVTAYQQRRFKTRARGLQFFDGGHYYAVAPTGERRGGWPELCGLWMLKLSGSLVAVVDSQQPQPVLQLPILAGEAFLTEQFALFCGKSVGHIVATKRGNQGRDNASYH